MSIHEETPLRPLFSGAVIVLLLLSVCILPFVGLRELFGRESEFAAMLREISWSAPYPAVHGELLPYRYPLFPLLAKTIMDWFSLSPEWALRLVSFGSLTAIALMVWSAAARAMKSWESGVIAAAATLSTVFMIDRGLWGVPDLTAAAFILAGWLLLFEFGMARNRWWRAWFSAATFLSLAFLTSGPSAVLIFLIPIPFMPRPISGLKRLQRPESLIGLCLVAVVIASWEALRLSELPEANAEAMLGIFTSWRNNNTLWILSAPFDLFFRLLPWALFLYPAFCPAYRVFERNPVFVRYVRTLWIAVCVLVLLVPWFRISDDAKILVPVMAILVSIYYPIFIRRNGTMILRLLRPAAVLLLLASFLMLAYHALSPQLAAVFTQVTVPEQGLVGEGLHIFRNLWTHPEKLEALRWIAIGTACYAILLSLTLISPAGRRLPIWVQLALMMVVGAQLYWGVAWHRQIFNTDYSSRAERLRQAVQEYTDQPVHKLIFYMDQHAPTLYAEGVYLGARFRRLHSLTDLPTSDSVVYLLSNDVPTPVPGRIWEEKPLLRDSYYESHLYLWAGRAAADSMIRPTEKKRMLLIP